MMLLNAIPKLVQIRLLKYLIFVVATCPQGTFMLNGGGGCADLSLIQQSAPASLNSWAVVCLGGKWKSGDTVAYATCCKTSSS